MYHIKPDKRSQASAEAFVQGLQACLKTKPLKTITVSDLHNVTGISRSTFYRLFETPEDVLIYQLDQMSAEINRSHREKGNIPATVLMEETIGLGLQNYAFIRALVENGRLDLLFQYTEQSFHYADRLYSLISADLEKEERDYVIAFLSMTLVATQIGWARNGRKETPKELIRYLQRYSEVLSAMIGGSYAGSREREEPQQGSQMKQAAG